MKKFYFKSYILRHQMISWLRDIDVKGFRSASVKLPQLLLPKAEVTGAYVLKTLHGFFLKIDPSKDNGVERSLHETGTYEKGILNFLETELKTGDCFVDVGANIGLISIFAARLVKANGTVLAFEAHPTTAQLLKENGQLNEIQNIQICEFGLGAENTSAVIYDNWEVNRGGASLVVKSENSLSYPIEIKRLDDVIASDLIPKIIKIDVEGFELEVLKGAQKTIQKFLPIIIIEFSFDRNNPYNSPMELVDFIKNSGPYRFYKLKGGKERKSKLIEIKTQNDYPKHDNVICIASKA